jgi:hypothetical protein
MKDVSRSNYMYMIMKMTCRKLEVYTQSLQLEKMKRTLLELEGTKVKVKVTLEHAMKAQRGSRGIALLFL